MQEELTEEEKLAAEAKELDLLTEKGMHFNVPTQSWLSRLLRKKSRRFVIKHLKGGTNHYLSAEYVLMQFDEQALQADPFGESKRLLFINAKRTARVVAIAVLNSKWKIRLFTGILANYFLWRLTSNDILKISEIIMRMMDIGDFTTSIRLLSINRTTNPKLMEKKEPQVA